MHPTASVFVMMGVSGVALGVAAAALLGYRRVAAAARVSPWPFSMGLVAWIAATAALAATGLFTRWTLRPPPFFVLAVISIVGAVLLSRSAAGRRLADGLPLWMLVVFEAFRLPLELFMHAAAGEGTMPTQMSYSGLNFDIVTGFTAILVAVAARRGASEKLVRAWNVLGLSLLAAIVGIAVVSTPVIAAFGPTRLNTWIAYFPFVWMITVNVPAALFGHLLILRKLRASGSATTAPTCGIVSPA